MKQNTFTRILLCLYLPIALVPAFSQEKRLSYDQAFKWGQPRLFKSLPRLQWYDSRTLLKTTSEKGVMHYILVDAETEAETLLFDSGVMKENLDIPKSISLNSAGWNSDYSAAVILHQGNIYYLNRNNKIFRQLTASAHPAHNPVLSPDGSYIGFTREHNLFVVDVKTGLEKQLTADGSDYVYNGWASWVYYEEVLGRRSRYRAFYWSPDSRKIAFLKFDDTDVPVFTLFNADGVHGQLEKAHYPKPGDPNPEVALGIVSIETGKTVWVDTAIEKDQYIAWVFWTPDSNTLLFQWMNRGQDTIAIFGCDPATGKRNRIYREHQDSWVEFFEDLYIFKDSKHLLLRSGKTGWPQLYICAMDGSQEKQLTRGEWSVKSIAMVDEDKGLVYVTGSDNPSTDNHLYSVNIKKYKTRKLTTGSGSHYTTLSPGGLYFIDQYSNIETLGVLNLHTGNGAFVRTIETSATPELNEYALGRTELFTIPSGDGYDLPAVWTLPPDFDPGKKYPVLFSVYGGPGSASVRNSYQRLRNLYLAQQGIIVFSVDHRGSGHFGKKGMAMMHRNLGKWEMHDYTAAATWLRNKNFVDTERIGITGGSYGGYVTCMALTCGAEYFTHGNALYSVTDWKLYDSIYTERYMDTPEENPAGYNFGSVMTHAEKYTNGLRIVHGSLDDNVHMQNTIQFIDKLQNLDKPFELMIYPNQRHGIGFPKYYHSTRESYEFWMRSFFPEQ